MEIKDGSEITIKLTEPSDEEALKKFMLDLPESERVFFRDDVTDPEVIHSWTSNIDLKRVIPIMAIRDGKILANWTLHHQEHGWIRHHAQLRGIVAPDYRGKGIATAMVHTLLSFAKQLNIERVVVEFVEPQRDLLSRYQKIGFKIDAVLKDWVKDFRGRYNDIHVLSMQFEPAWRKMEELIYGYGTHGG